MQILSDKLELGPILTLIRSSVETTVMHGHKVKLTSVRLQTFATKGVDCISCNTKGAFFRIEDNTCGAHLNLYGLNDDGDEVLMTRDHMVPSSKGGSDHLANMNTMCTKCNKRKGVKSMDDFMKNVEGKPKVLLAIDKVNIVLDELIAAFSTSHGIINAIINNRLNKKWKRDNLKATYSDLSDLEVRASTAICSASSAGRGKARKYLMKKYNIKAPERVMLEKKDPKILLSKAVKLLNIVLSDQGPDTMNEIQKFLEIDYDA